MKTKIFFLLFFFSLCLTSVKAQWKMVYDSGTWDIGPSIFVDKNMSIIIRNDYGLAISRDTGITWKQVSISDDLSTSNGFLRRNNKLLISTPLKVYQSLDDGNTWNPLSTWPSFANGWYGFTESGSNILASSVYGRVLISKDDGASWDSSNTGLPPTGGIGNTRFFSGFAKLGYGADPKKSDYLFCISRDKSFYSTDHGETWNFKHDSCPLLGAFISIGNTIIGANDKLYISKDSGSTWENIFSPAAPINWVRGISTDGKLLFAGVKSEGVIMSHDSGQNWIYINKGLTHLDVLNTAVFGRYIFCSAASGKVYRRELSELTGQEERTGINEDNKKDLKLKAYPNPAQHSATLAFGRQLKNAEVKVYNNQSQEVHSIQNINAQEIIIRANTLPPGIYFYVLREENKKLATGKLIIE